MTAPDAQATAQLSLRVSRLINAPRRRVFEAWIKPELRRRWWFAGTENQLTNCEIDARVGGTYCQKQIGGCEDAPNVPDDYEWIMEGEFLEITEPQRLVFTWNVNHPDEPQVEQRVTVDFIDVDGATKVTITHERIPTTPMRDGTKEGWTKLLELLAGVLEQR